MSAGGGLRNISIALHITGNSINLNSGLGVLLVAGVSVNSGILLYDESLAGFVRSGTPAARSRLPRNNRKASPCFNDQSHHSYSPPPADGKPFGGFQSGVAGSCGYRRNCLFNPDFAFASAREFCL